MTREAQASSCSQVAFKRAPGAPGSLLAGLKDEDDPGSRLRTVFVNTLAEPALSRTPKVSAPVAGGSPPKRGTVPAQVADRDASASSPSGASIERHRRRRTP